jgi:hypothetical protein
LTGSRPSWDRPSHGFLRKVFLFYVKILSQNHLPYPPIFTYTSLMKKHLTIILLLILIILAGLFILQQQKGASDSNTVSPTPVPVVDSSEWSTYSDNYLSFQYPNMISIKREGEVLRLSHSIAYRHPDPCDFKGDAPEKTILTDFDASFTVVNQNLKEYVESSDFPGWDYVSNNPFEFTTFRGYAVKLGVEGCGEVIYYFSISPNKTLVIKHALVTVFNPIIANYQEYLKLPGIIDPTEEFLIFNRLLGSLEVK